MLYEPKFKPKPAVTRREIAAIIALGVPGLWLVINTFFASMPVMERLGAVICHHLFGI